MLALLVLPAVGQKASSEQAAARYLESVRHQPSQLLAFIREMPKGGDLHNHLSGAVYAESYIDWAAADGLCVDPKTDAIARAHRDADSSRLAAGAREGNHTAIQNISGEVAVRGIERGV